LIESSSAWKNVYIQNIPKYQPKEHQAPGIAFQVTSESTGSSHTSAEISLFFLLMELQLGHLNQSSMSMLSLDFHEFLDEVSELNILEKNGTGR
jgi:hypothetical protein